MRTLLATLVFLPCLSCSPAVSTAQKEPEKLTLPSEQQADKSKSEPKDALIASEKPPESEQSKVDVQTLVEGNNQFAFDLYARLSKKEGNVLFSPYSISTALAMTYAGAKGNTAREMAQTLHFTPDGDSVHPDFGELIRSVQHVDKKGDNEFVVANRMWGDKSRLSPSPRFLHILENDYSAGIQFIEFGKDSEGARREINDWIADQTNKKIKDLLSRDSISDHTRIVLANAVYFKKDWAEPFPKANTTRDGFTTTDGATVMVPMMNRAFDLNYMENAYYQLVQFMYEGGEFSFVVILPKAKDGLLSVEQVISSKSFERNLAGAKQTRLNVFLPKFKVTEQVQLAAMLSQLGMRDAFIEGTADFSGIETDVRLERKLYVSKIIHKALLEVDEKGNRSHWSHSSDASFGLADFFCAVSGRPSFHFHDTA